MFNSRSIVALAGNTQIAAFRYLCFYGEAKKESATRIEAICTDIRANNRVNDKWYVATLCKANGISEKHIRTILKAE